MKIFFEMVRQVRRCIRARHIKGDEMQVAFALSNLTGRAKTWALGLKIHDPNVLESLEILKSRLKERFEPPRAEFRARSALLRLKKGKRDVHAYAQHLRYLASRVTQNPVDEHTLINVFIYGLVDGPVKTYMFREDFHTLEGATAYAKAFSLRQSQANSSNYRPTRRQETGGPEPMALCYIESDNSRSLSTIERQDAISFRRLSTTIMSVVSRALQHVQKKTGRDDRRWPRKGPRRGSDHVAKPRQRVGPSKQRTGSVGAEHSPDLATSREFAGHLTKIAPNTQSLCFTAPSDEESLITLKIEVTSGMSLCALVECGAPNIFIRRQSLEDSRLNYVELEIPPTRITV
uniref:Retrotransposon gag domain-containing protein n=1 Tax=Peronospora matthiolae TaxID=2874970 RepID=A0AAV1UB86_9STRA